MMKTLLMLLMLLTMLIPMAAPAETTTQRDLSYIEEKLPDKPLWTAEVRVETRLRIRKDLDRKDWLSRVDVKDVVDVYCYVGEWCVVGANGDIGYMPTNRLTNFRQLTREILPGGTRVEGIATLTQDIHLDVEGYRGGNDAAAGTLICTQESGLLPMMRATATLPEGSFTFEPFVPSADAQPGDVLYGFTTFYNDSLGGKHPANRVFNIELSVERLQGVTIGAGEKFSFNQYCGPYKKKNGYQYAKNVSRDGYGYGGGVCQVSTTIFNAIMPLAHTLDEWQLHSVSGVKYVPRNLDAAVASSRDFSFYNNEPFALDMEVMAQEGVLTVIFRRAEEEKSPAETEPVPETDEMAQDAAPTEPEVSALPADQPES